jgi:hypothetical protein
MNINKQEFVDPVITTIEKLNILKALRPGLSDEDKLSILREALKGRPSLKDRGNYISSSFNNPETNKEISNVSLVASASISTSPNRTTITISKAGCPEIYRRRDD